MPAVKPTDEARVALAGAALGTMLSESRLLEYCGMEDLFEEDEVTEILLSENIERCPECEWWVESSELVDDECNPIPCYGCRGTTDEEDDDEMF